MYTTKEIDKKYTKLVNLYNTGYYKFIDFVGFLELKNDGTGLMSKIILHAKNDF